MKLMSRNIQEAAGSARAAAAEWEPAVQESTGYARVAQGVCAAQEGVTVRRPALVRKWLTVCAQGGWAGGRELTSMLHERLLTLGVCERTKTLGKKSSCKTA